MRISLFDLRRRATESTEPREGSRLLRRDGRVSARPAALLGLAVALAVTGCGGSGGEEVEPQVMPDVVDLQLDIALSDIERAGFEDEVEVLGGGTFGVVDESNWKVCEQLPAAGEPLTETPRVTVDRSCGEEADESTTTVAETTTSAAPPPTTAPVAEETLTTANNPELAAILADTDYCSDRIQAFASTYPGRTIEFDGSIDALGPHGSYDTRHDILVSAGDFDPDSAPGPAFQFRDVGMIDLGLTGPNVPDYVGPGDNLHVVAKVVMYEANSCLFLLDPVSTEVR